MRGKILRQSVRICTLLLLISFLSSNSPIRPETVTAHDIFAPVFDIGGSGTVDGNFDFPVGVVTYNNLIYTVDRYNNRIQVFDSKGQFQLKFGGTGIGNGDFNFPSGIAVDSENIYVTDTDNEVVQVFDHNGVFQTQFGRLDLRAGIFNAPTGIALNLSHIFVVDSIDNQVLIFDSDLNHLASFGEFGTNPSQFDNPHGIAVNSNHIFVVDTDNHRIQIFDLNGTYQDQFGTIGSGNGQFNFPYYVTLSEQYIFITDTNNRVQIFDLAGNFVATFGAFGHVEYYTTFYSGSMQYYTHTDLGNYYAFDYPQGIATNYTHLFISDAQNDRIRVFAYHFHDDVVISTKTFTTDSCDCGTEGTNSKADLSTSLFYTTSIIRRTTTESYQKSEAGSFGFFIFGVTVIMLLVITRKYVKR